MKKLKMSDVFSKEGYNALTAAERRFYLKTEQAKEYSGLRKFPSTCSAVFDRIPPEYWEKYSAKEIGEFAKLLYKAYSDGKNA